MLASGLLFSILFERPGGLFDLIHHLLASIADSD